MSDETLAPELETLARLMRQLPEVERELARCAALYESAKSNVEYVKEGIDEVRLSVCNKLMPPNIVVEGPQAPAQADPPSELRSVTPATEESAGGGMPDDVVERITAGTLAFMSGPVWRFLPEQSAPSTDQGGYAPVMNVDEPDLAQIAIEAFMQRPGAIAFDGGQLPHPEDIVDVICNDGNMTCGYPAGAFYWLRDLDAFIVAYAPAAEHAEAAE